jgi:iron complex outermembrane receptor protein
MTHPPITEGGSDMVGRSSRCRTTLTAGVLGLVALSSVTSAWAQDKEERRRQLLRQLEAIQNELKALDAPTSAPGPTPPSPPPTAQEQPPVLPPVQVRATPVIPPPVGSTVNTIERDDFKFTRGFSVNELTEGTPGIFSKQGNGPRDVGISIRGSGAKVGFGIRNIKVYEDWFPVTQSDGLSRSDITDPHAYEGVDIVRGPSSARYDNYALGGVVNYRLRRGRDIDGLELGNDMGSFGYHNHYLTLGGLRNAFEYSLFASYVAADGFLEHSAFHASTENVLLTYAIDPGRALTFKLINNDTTTDVPSRLSRNQFRADPFDAGTVSVAVAGAANLTVTAEQAAQAREDRRTIAGVRYDQQIFDKTTASVTGVFDLKDINQTFGTIGDNENPNFNGMLDVTSELALWDMPARHYIGLFANYMEQEAASFFNVADGHGTRGALQSGTRGYIRNLGGRIREELTLLPGWILVLGLGGERSEVAGELRTRLAAERFRYIRFSRTFDNVAPELALIYAPSPDFSARFRVGTGYGIPGFGNLTTTSSGLPGNNTTLKAQKNVGVDLGFDARRLLGVLDLGVTGYYEWFQDEFNTVSPGAGLSAFTTNAPASEHRGVEVFATLRPLASVDGWEGLYLRAAYTFNDHVYTDFRELVSGARLDRDGKQIPGVERSFLNAKVGYESPWRLGGWLELNYVDDYFINNSNTLRAPGYNVLNANMHYAQGFSGSFLRGFETFFEVRNLLDRTYIESAIPVSDDLIQSLASLNGKQAFFTGSPRTFYGGVRLKF